MELKNDFDCVKKYLNKLVEDHKLVVTMSTQNLEIVVNLLDNLDNSIRTYKQFLVETQNTKTYSIWLKNKNVK